MISNCRGDLEALLKDLKGRFGCGGKVSGDTVEIQGEQHAEKVTQFLLGSGSLVGASTQVKDAISEAAAKRKETQQLIPSTTELRIDITDGNAYSLDSFIEVYGGSRLKPPHEWTIAKKKGTVPKSAGGTQGKSSSRLVAVDRELEPKEIKMMKPPELKAQLRARGASIQGNKKELIMRLIELSCK